jgi:hypothetical protein
MATTTPNFGWVVPTSTDLVKDGATAIETLGDSIDASLLDLKGGTSGQVLSKNSNTDMDFVWVTDAAGDIQGVTAGVGISGGGTSGTVTVTNSMATAITTAGDLIKGTGSGTFDRLGIGTAGQYLKVNSGATAPEWATLVTSPTFVGVGLIMNGTSTSITQNTQLTFAFPSGSEDYDTNAFHDNTTNNARITIPTGYGGKYLITSQIMCPDNWNGYGYGYLYKNGSSMTNIGLYNDSRFGSLALTDGINALIGSTTISLAAADYLELRFQSAITTGAHSMYIRWTATWLGA